MGRVEIQRIRLPFSNSNRLLRIYTPTDYDENKTKTYPVIYMQDGQNLFFDEEAFGGSSWRIKDTMESFEREGLCEGFIVVGIDNGGICRMKDYSPWPYIDQEDFGENVQGEQYANFLAYILKPYIDEKYRTNPDSNCTCVCGSSAGANISAYTALKYPEVFGHAGIFSLATWLFPQAFDEFLQSMMLENCEQSYYIFTGSEEGKEDRNLSQTYIDTALGFYVRLLDRGTNIDRIDLNILSGGEHNESCWADHFPCFLEFLIEQIR